MQKSVYEYISHLNNDPIIQRRTCEISGKELAVFQSDLDFYDKISPTIGGKKFQIPTPNISPEERQRKRLLWRNERKLYKRICDATGKNIVCMYSPDKNLKVYEHKYRRSDARDAMNYGRDFDFSKTLAEQFKSLITEVPKFAVYNPGSENSEYANISINAKNCYLAYVSSFSEDVYFSHRAIYCKDSMDLYRCSECENCYGMNGGLKLNNCTFSYDLESCTDCNYCVNLVGCFNCLLCNNLVNKSFCIENTQYTKEEYYKKIGEYAKTTAEKYKNILHTYTRPAVKNYGGENVIGNGNFYGKNLVMCSNLDEGRDNKYYDEGAKGLESCMDCNYGKNSTLCYESVSPSDGYANIATSFTLNAKNIYYSIFCFDCQNCFACDGLRNKEYCILNKQYTKAEYEALVPQIIEHITKTGERGNFFDPSISPFDYNETVANEYLPLSRTEALARGYAWQDNTYDPAIPAGAETIKGDQIPNDISLVNDEILKKIFICEVSGRPFRIIKQELDFYRKHNLPLPRKHPDVRHQERLEQKPGRELFLRNCDKCNVEMLSVYPVEMQNIASVLCQSCYNKEIYG